VSALARDPKRRGAAFTAALAALEADSHANLNKLPGLTEQDREVIAPLVALLRGEPQDDRRPPTTDRRPQTGDLQSAVNRRLSAVFNSGPRSAVSGLLWLWNLFSIKKRSFLALLPMPGGSRASLRLKT
jgi:hypothetical protein